MNQISPLAYVHPDAKMGDGNIIGPFCVIDADVEIGDNNHFLNNVTLHEGLRMGSGNEVFPGASLSTKPQDLKFHGEKTVCIVGNNNSIRENVTLSRGTFSKEKTVIGDNNLLMEDVHIAHDCVVGSGCIIGNNSNLAGEVTVDDCAILSACVQVHQFTNIGSYVMIQGLAKVVMDIPPFIIAGKEPTHYCGLNLVGLRRRGFSPERIDKIHDAYRILYGMGLLSERLDQLKALPENDDIDYIIHFVEKSQRGLIRG